MTRWLREANDAYPKAGQAAPISVRVVKHRSGLWVLSHHPKADFLWRWGQVETGGPVRPWKVLNEQRRALDGGGNQPPLD